MTRRAALATAGAITIVLLAAAAAIATNLGMLRVATNTEAAGGLRPTDLAPTVTAHQPANDVGGRRTDDTGGALVHAPGDDGSADHQSGIEPNDDQRSPDSRPQDKGYEGRDDDD